MGYICCWDILENYGYHLIFDLILQIKICTTSLIKSSQVGFALIWPCIPIWSVADHQQDTLPLCLKSRWKCVFSPYIEKFVSARLCWKPLKFLGNQHSLYRRNAHNAGYNSRSTISETQYLSPEHLDFCSTTSSGPPCYMPICHVLQIMLETSARAHLDFVWPLLLGLYLFMPCAKSVCTRPSWISVRPAAAPAWVSCFMLHMLYMLKQLEYTS